MSLKSLRAFLKTTELGSFSAASRALGLTPAAVSKSVGELEENLSVRLFHRNTRSLSLTEDGISFLHEVKPAINVIDNALSRSRNAELIPAGKLKINIPESFGRKFVLPLISEFLRIYPLIKLDIHLQDRKVDPIVEGYSGPQFSDIELRC